MRLCADPQARAIDAIVPFIGEDALTVAGPFHIAGERKAAPRHAPTVGQHGEEVLREAGFGEAEVTRLREQQVLG